MNITHAIQRIRAVFSQYKALRPSDSTHLQALGKGKIYELYVLSKLVGNLANRGCWLSFTGSTLKFKAAPGKIRLSEPHFLVATPNGARYQMLVDIEFDTMGSKWLAGQLQADRSARHELDLVVVNAHYPYPSHDEVLLAVECKAQANFDKQIVRAALGVRRELSLLVKPQPSWITQAGGTPPVYVPAKPASEFWLAYLDPKGSHYYSSPAQFGIDFRYIPVP